MTRFGETAAGWSQGDATVVDGPAILVIADDARRAAAEEAVASAGGSVIGPTAWRNAQERLGRQGAIRIVLAEARGVEAEALTENLPLLDALARNGDARIVVTLDFDQIDLVAASLTAPGIDLLCAPTQSERFVALRLAGHAYGGDLREVGREREAARMQQLHEEVARIAESLAALRGMSLGELAVQTRANALAVMPKLAGVY